MHSRDATLSHSCAWDVTLTPSPTLPPLPVSITLTAIFSVVFGLPLGGCLGKIGSPKTSWASHGHRDAGDNMSSFPGDTQAAPARPPGGCTWVHHPRTTTRPERAGLENFGDATPQMGVFCTTFFTPVIASLSHSYYYICVGLHMLWTL